MGIAEFKVGGQTVVLVHPTGGEIVAVNWRTQRDKDAGVYSVKAAMQRANFMDQAEP